VLVKVAVIVADPGPTIVRAPVWGSIVATVWLLEAQVTAGTGVVVALE
jgi:hypothetical protein